MDLFRNHDRRFRYQSRLLEIPALIRDLSIRNPVVAEILEKFADGVIITKEEALCQMIVAMDKNWSELQRQACDAMLNLPLKPIVPA